MTFFGKSASWSLSSQYDATRAYALSKLANVLHTKELAQRLKVSSFIILFRILIAEEKAIFVVFFLMFIFVELSNCVIEDCFNTLIS